MTANTHINNNVNKYIVKKNKVYFLYITNLSNVKEKLVDRQIDLRICNISLVGLSMALNSLILMKSIHGILLRINDGKCQIYC